MCKKTRHIKKSDRFEFTPFTHFKVEYVGKH